MDLLLRGRTALVTGASKGIGAAIARRLADEGVDLYLVARGGAQLADLARELRAEHNVSVTPLTADLGTPEGRDAVARACADVDILVNNAGAIPPGSLNEVSEREWRAAWDLKVYGTILLSQALYPQIARTRGVILNVIGVAGEDCPEDYIVGAAGNAGLMAFTKALAKTASRDGARVVGINPGYIATQRRERMLRARAETQLGSAERWRELDAALPYGRAGTPDEIAAAAAFLVSPLSGYTNGAVLTVDGGS